MDVTSPPDVRQEAVADVAMKTYTLYFLVSALILGVLLFAAIRKASKICCWNCIYGSKYIRDQKEDPRVPPSVFRTPSVLATLQDRYDKYKSSIRSKSETTSQNYVRAQDIEMGSINQDMGTLDTEPRKTFSGLLAETDENARIHRYLDSMDNSIPDRVEDGDKADDDDTKVVEIELSDDGTPDQTYNSNLHNGLSNYGSLPPSDAETSQRHESHDDDEKHESLVFDNGNIGDVGAYSSSNSTLRSITSDGTPLVSMDPTGDTNRRGRYKKNRGMSSSTTGTGISNRTASAKSSKKAGRAMDRY